MSEYKGRINVSKDTMLFVVNEVLNQEIKENTTKENILKMIPKIYKKVDAREIIKLLPYGSYKSLESLMNYIKTSDNIKEFFYKEVHQEVRYLEETMIIVMRANHGKYEYSLNPGVIQNLAKLYSEENRKIAERYGKIENLTKGILYSYGIVEFNFLKETICKNMKEIISQEELEDLYYKRLNLNMMVNYKEIKWTNSNETELFATYIDDEWEPIDIVDIAVEQKSRGLKYKKFSEKEILSREEYLWDKSTQNFFNYIKSKNQNIWELKFQRIVKENEFGKDILRILIEECNFESEEDIEEFMQHFMNWYNNSPQYVLGGYSPIEFRKIHN